ncbi:MAG TPA: radical SAM protein [Candidatus Thermoplasmatota archaeon]|nr:radical SAM protein [Candidatus Thermoplasmatota archaeon]
MTPSTARSVERIHGDSLAVGPLAQGCKQCARGEKLVLYVTGVCHWKCFYCPVSAARRNKDQLYANERRIDPAAPDAVARVVDEARLIGAHGTGITGGDPMYAPERVVAYCRALKDAFGPRHHVHLYTQVDFDPAWLAKLKDAGLDEIRFHPPEEHWSDMDAGHHARLVPAARKAGLVVGVEIPILPPMHEETMALLRWCAENGVRFVNVNELEFSETNARKLLARGFDYASDDTNKVAGAEAAARRILLESVGLRMPVHYCSSPFKDRIQLAQRFRRRAERVKRPHEIVTEEGTLLRGVVECPDPRALRESLRDDFDVPADLAVVRKDRLEVAPWVLEKIAKRIPHPCFLSEVHPTDEEVEVERTPLNRARSRPVP